MADEYLSKLQESINKNGNGCSQDDKEKKVLGIVLVMGEAWSRLGFVKVKAKTEEEAKTLIQSELKKLESELAEIKKYPGLQLCIGW